MYDKNSLIKKCCPFGQIFQEGEEGRPRCTPGERKLDVETIYAVFYGESECIEDKENKLHFNYEPNDSCLGNNMTFQYSKEQGDQLFVIQNGSLLVLEDAGFMSVFDQYCVEVDVNSRLLAKVCDEIEPIVLKSTAALIYAGMMMASVALLVTCIAYALVPKLNDVFGYLLATHSGAFLVGLIMMTLAVCGDRCVAKSDIGMFMNNMIQDCMNYDEFFSCSNCSDLRPNIPDVFSFHVFTDERLQLCVCRILPSEWIGIRHQKQTRCVQFPRSALHHYFDAFIFAMEA